MIWVIDMIHNDNEMGQKSTVFLTARTRILKNIASQYYSLQKWEFPILPQETDRLIYYYGENRWFREFNALSDFATLKILNSDLIISTSDFRNEWIFTVSIDCAPTNFILDFTLSNLHLELKEYFENCNPNIPMEVVHTIILPCLQL